MTRQKWNRLWKIAKPVLILGLLLSFFYFVPVNAILTAFRSADMGYFLGSIVLSIPTFYLSALTLWVLTRKQQIHFSIWELVKMNLVVRFYAFFSPASIVGSGMRWYQLSKGGKAAAALSAVTMDRALDILISVALGLFWILSGFQKDSFNPFTLLLMFVILIAGWFVLTRWSPGISGWFAHAAGGMQPSLMRTSLQFLNHLFQSLSIYASFSTLELIILLGANLVSELINLLIQVFLALALHIQISVVDLGWMRSLFFLASLAPFTLTGGFGLREVTVVLVMSAFGVRPELAGAYSLLSYTRSMLVSLIGGIFELHGLLPAGSK